MGCPPGDAFDADGGEGGRSRSANAGLRGLRGLPLALEPPTASPWSLAWSRSRPWTRGRLPSHPPHPGALDFFFPPLPPRTPPELGPAPSSSSSLDQSSQSCLPFFPLRGILARDEGLRQVTPRPVPPLVLQACDAAGLRRADERVSHGARARDLSRPLRCYARVAHPTAPCPRRVSRGPRLRRVSLRLAEARARPRAPARPRGAPSRVVPETRAAGKRAPTPSTTPRRGRTTRGTTTNAGCTFVP